jgi:hypothetical protein
MPDWQIVRSALSCRGREKTSPCHRAVGPNWARVGKLFQRLRDAAKASYE